MFIIEAVIAYLIDIIVGDPQKFTHPVVLIGKLISFLEGFLRRKEDSRLKQIIKGFILVGLVIAVVYLSTFLLIKGLNFINRYLGLLAGIWLLSTTIASKSLATAGREIYQLISQDNLLEARKKVGWIVGRDTHELNSSEITRATIETIAENIVDGIIAPLFFGWLGGAPLAMTYRAINTMDSMLGYKNEKYLFFGKASARIDDVANFIPARITAVLILVLSILIPGYDAKNSFQALISDAKKHPSPNSGWPEAAVAGALKIKLGGLNYYGGIPSFRATMGPGLRNFEISDINKTIFLMYGTGVMFSVIMILFLIIMRGY